MVDVGALISALCEQMRDALFDGETDPNEALDRGHDRDSERERRPRFRKPYRLSSYRPMAAGFALADLVAPRGRR